jgi:adenine phosphoribosyltransferase
MNKESLSQLLKSEIRNIPDFPKKGIQFKDITSVLHNPQLNKMVLECLVQDCTSLKIDVVVGLESRGFLYGNALAIALGVPFVPIRKKGKLPFHTISEKYELEYKKSEIEIHIDAIKNGQNVLIHDDLLATGGTAEATAKLINKLGGNVVGFSFVVALGFLKGEQKLKEYSDYVDSLVVFD